MQQPANVLFRYAPILAFAPFKLFVVDSSVEPLKCVSETNRIGSKILIDVSFNQQMAMRSARFRQNTQCGQAGSELIHLAFAILTCE